MSANVFAQEGLVTIQPSSATGEDEVTIIYDATLGATSLVGAEKVYMHSGVIVDAPDGTEWQYVVGNYGQDDGIGQMTKVEGEENKWQITISPSIRAFYNVPEGTNIFRLSMVFRNADGSAEGKGNPGSYSWGTVAGNQDIFVDLNVDNFVQITNPEEDELFVTSGEIITFNAVASSNVTAMAMFIDEGSGFSEVTNVTSGTTISYDYTTSTSGTLKVRVTADIAGESVQSERTFEVNVRPATAEAPLPSNVMKGINYINANTVVLVLEAPLKEFVYAVGDFSNWEVQDEYLMLKAPGTDLFWVEINGLTAGQKYVFQYWVEGNIRIADPYADEIADPDDDPFIPASVHPNIAPYSQSYGPASVLQTNQTPFVWAASEDTWTPPAQDELIIYELLLRDFLGTHSYDDLIDTLSYLDRLGVNAIELMPVMEFEGNISWGYNVSHFFAVDKYYGTKADFKRFVQAAHQQGIAVIMDMVLNHAFGENPLVRMYFENGRPTSESPWFNQDATHPFNVGYDFNHESAYTQDFVDSVNYYWLSEYHIDGYRYDLSKGFTQTNNPNDVGAWSAYDASRIAIINRMEADVRDDFPESYIILEHFAAAAEEEELAANNMVLWRNMNFSYHEALVGSPGDFGGATAKTHVSYMESHDEERIMFEAYGKGVSSGSYSTSDTVILLERAKMAAAFFFTLPGPKMIWQFGELGYDVELNDDRLGQKPLPWGPDGVGYYDDELRQYVYDAYSAILNLRKDYSAEWNNANYTNDFDGLFRSIVIDGATTNFVIVGNFGITDQTGSVTFTQAGMWYDFFSGESVDITTASTEMTLKPGEFHIYSDQQVSNGFENVVEVFDLPVTITPTPFTKDDEITIRFDASKANPDGTAGLIGASSVFMRAGVVTEAGEDKTLTQIVDGAEAALTPVEGETDIWEITLIPSQYFGVAAETNIYKIGMYFRDESGSNFGKGFRGETIYVNVLIDGNMVSITPTTFTQDDQITIVFDARFGSGSLIGAEKVYMHSGVVLSDLESPTGNDWTKIVGTWGADNGVGQMIPVDGQPNTWQITLTPRQYYNITASQQAYWVAMVFRNADGTREAKATQEMTIDNGYIAANGDIFMRVEPSEQVVGLEDEFNIQTLRMYPNPASHSVMLETFDGIGGEIEIINLRGQVMVKEEVFNNKTEIVINHFPAGLYLVKMINASGNIETTKLIIREKE